MNEVIRTILSRRSTRIFKEDPLKDEEIGQILEAAKYAPSGTNQQPWNFTVVSNKELIDVALFWLAFFSKLFSHHTK